MNWYDNAVKQLEQSLENGEITDEEFQAEIRNLNEELRETANEVAEQAYNDVMGDW